MQSKMRAQFGSDGSELVTIIGITLLAALAGLGQPVPPGTPNPPFYGDPLLPTNATAGYSAVSIQGVPLPALYTMFPSQPGTGLGGIGCASTADWVPSGGAWTNSVGIGGPFATFTYPTPMGWSCTYPSFLDNTRWSASNLIVAVVYARGWSTPSTIPFTSYAYMDSSPTSTGSVLIVNYFPPVNYNEGGYLTVTTTSNMLNGWAGIPTHWPYGPPQLGSPPPLPKPPGLPGQNDPLALCDVVSGSTYTILGSSNLVNWQVVSNYTVPASDTNGWSMVTVSWLTNASWSTNGGGAFYQFSGTNWFY